MTSKSNSGMWLPIARVLEACRLIMDDIISRHKAELEALNQEKAKWGQRESLRRKVEIKQNILDNPHLINSYAVAMNLAALTEAGSDMIGDGKVWVTAEDFSLIKSHYNLRNES